MNRVLFIIVMYIIAVSCDPVVHNFGSFKYTVKNNTTEVLGFFLKTSLGDAMEIVDPNMEKSVLFVQEIDNYQYLTLIAIDEFKICNLADTTSIRCVVRDNSFEIEDKDLEEKLNKVSDVLWDSNSISYKVKDSYCVDSFDDLVIIEEMLPFFEKDYTMLVTFKDYYEQQP